MRDGATHRFGCVDGRMTSANAHVGLGDRVVDAARDLVDMSRYDIVLLAWGSRSMSSVGLPRSDRAAARLMAVVVLPTPPFWLAIATIIGWWRQENSQGVRPL